MTSFSVGGLLLALVVAIVKLVVGVLIIALFENSMARLRFCATSRVTWAGFGFAFLAFVSLAGGVIKRSLSMSEEKIGQHYLAALHQAFPGVVLDEAWQTKDQLTITVKVNYLPEVVEFLYYQQGGWLSVLFGNDERKLNGHYAVYYVLSMEQGTKCWITVRVEVDANKPEYLGDAARVPAAVWGEREVRDMYGLVPVGLPDERRLVLPDDWPDELHPLRKDSMDYRQRPAPTTDAETYGVY